MIRTAFLSWFLIRLMLSVANVPDPAWATSVLIVVLAGLGPLLDMRVAGELHVFESTGLHPLSTLWIGLPAAGFIEGLAQLLT